MELYTVHSTQGFQPLRKMLILPCFKTSHQKPESNQDLLVYMTPGNNFSPPPLFYIFS